MTPSILVSQECKKVYKCLHSSNVLKHMLIHDIDLKQLDALIDPYLKLTLGYQPY